MIKKIIIHNLRNIESLTLEPSQKFNLLWGKNGSGKTSFLEAIYILGHGRSFRTYNSKGLITFDQSYLSIFANLEDKSSIRIEKQISNQRSIYINGENKQSASLLAQAFPQQLINADSYLLLNGGPKFRRHFIDWGLFHTEPAYFSLWKQCYRSIKHRNMALRQSLPSSQLVPWNYEIVKCGEQLDFLRKNYLEKYCKVLNDLLIDCWGFPLNIRYLRGWPDGVCLDDMLLKYLDGDQKRGYTRYGPHRADLQLHTDNGLAKEILSRGQQKLLLCAMKLAQGILLNDLTGKTCIYLIDDLAAELDQEKWVIFAKILAKLQAQVFITAVDQALLNVFQDYSDNRMFHVKHGVIELMDLPVIV